MDTRLRTSPYWLSWPNARSSQIALIILVAFAYFFTGTIGLLLAIPNTNVSTLWPPSGIALAAGLIYGYKIWPSIFLGSFVNNMVSFLNSSLDADYSTFIGVSTCIGIGSVLQMIAGVAAIHYWIANKNFLESAINVFKFLIIGKLSCLINSNIGTFSLFTAGIIPANQYSEIFWNWWLGDTAGVFVYTPLLWTWLKYPLPNLSTNKILEAALLLICLCIASVLLYKATFPIIFIFTPLMVWAAVRFSHHGATLLVVIASSIIIWEAYHGAFFLKYESMKNSFIFLQSYIGITTTMTLALGALVNEKKQAFDQLQDINLNLESLVQERTHEIQQAMEQLKVVQEQMIAQQKLASLGVLTAGIAHEIKNPLNFINNFAALSIKQANKLTDALEKTQVRLNSEERNEINKILDTITFNISKIIQHGKRANDIVKNMSAHSRSEMVLEYKMTDLNALIEYDIELIQQAMKAQESGLSFTLDYKLDPKLPKIKLIPQEFNRVLQNVFDNAFYAIHKKKIQLGEGFTPIISISTSNLGNNKILISIRDNGIGIPPSHIKKLFTPFFTTKPPGEGTGLGLSLSHDVIAGQHHGEMNLQSVEGEFTEVRIILPIDYETLI